MAKRIKYQVKDYQTEEVKIYKTRPEAEEAAKQIMKKGHFASLTELHDE